MALTPTQNATLKAFIENDVVLNAFPNNEDGADSIANIINQEETPDFTVWKTSVPLVQVGDAFDGGEFESLTTAETGRLTAFAAYSTDSGFEAGGGINPSLPDRRQFFDDIFSAAGGTITRPNLAILWRRLASTVEKLFSTGTGTDVDPATLDFEGDITRQEVFIARNS